MSSKIVSPQSGLASRNCMLLTNDKWTGEDSIKVSKAFQRLKYIRRAKAAVRVAAPYPEQNPQLANLIEEIKKHDLNIPLEKLTEMVVHPKCRTGIHEVAGPRGVLFILQYESPDISNAEHNVKEICYKYDFSYLSFQTQRLVFYDQKGILLATPGNEMSAEEAVELSTKAGAELISSKLDSDGKLSLEIYCNPSNLHQLKRRLEKFVIAEAFVGYIPKYLIDVPDSIKSKMADAIVDFSEICEIDMIYENVK